MMANVDRALRASRAILAYMGDDAEFYLHDLICDLGHWQERFGSRRDAGENEDLEQACRRGIESYLDEVAEEAAAWEGA